MALIERAANQMLELIRDDPALIHRLEAHMHTAVELAKECERRQSSFAQGSVVTSEANRMIMMGLLGQIATSLLGPVTDIPIAVSRAAFARAYDEEQGAPLASAL